MIKINEDFAIERDSSCWILRCYKDGISKETKQKIRVFTEVYPSTLKGCFERILELTAGKATNLKEMRKLILQCRDDILNAIGINCLTEITSKMEDNLAGHTRSSQDVETKSRGSKGESKRETSNSSNENEGVKGQIQAEGSKLSGEVHKKRGRRARKVGN